MITGTSYCMSECLVNESRNIYRAYLTASLTGINGTAGYQDISIEHNLPIGRCVRHDAYISGGFVLPFVDGDYSIVVRSITSTDINIRVRGTTWGDTTLYIILDYVL